MWLSSVMTLSASSLGSDADNIRVDDAAHRVFVEYGSRRAGREQESR
jgi:hypothetical protein